MNFTGKANATDNKDAVVPVTYDPSLTVSRFDIGKGYIITATATDSSKNNDTCQFYINVEGNDAFVNSPLIWLHDLSLQCFECFWIVICR